MEEKKWWKSKGVWTGIVTVVIGALYAIDLQFGTAITLSPAFGVVISILGALGIYSRTTANTVITK